MVDDPKKKALARWGNEGGAVPPKKKPKRPRDVNQLAKLMVDIATGEENDPTDEEKALSAAKRKGGIARKRSLTPEQRSDIASHAARARWKKSD